MIVKFPGFQLSFFVAGLALALGSCGGGGGGASGGAVATSDFLTADTQGVSGDVTLAGPGGPASMTRATDDVASAAGDLAAEIEAADLYRVEGNRLFLLNSYRGLVLVDLAARQITGRLAFSGVPSELYVSGDRAFVLATRFDGSGALLDVSLAIPSAPALSATIALSGAPFTSRKIGDRLIVVTRNEQSNRVESFLLGSVVTRVASVALPHFAQYTHASDGLLFLATNIDTGTFIQLVDTSDTAGQLALRGSFTLLSGSIGADDRLHFGGGTLRVVTRGVEPVLHSRLSIVDVSDPDQPHVRGTLDVGHGEQPFAARFTEERGYIVTFEQVDPLWVIDLSNPDHPVVSGELMVPGWSSQLVAWGDRLVALGADPTGGWHTTVSLFDVSNPALPTLASRVSIGSSGAPFNDPRAFGVFPESGLVLVSASDQVQGLAVVDLGPNALSLRGWIDTGEETLRGFPHASGLCAITATGLSIANPSNLSSVEKIVVAEDVVDVARVGANGAGGGRLVNLTTEGGSARIGNVRLPLSPERLHAHGTAAAVTGWDSLGRAAYVVDFATPTPTLSPRIDLGTTDFAAFPSQTGGQCIWSGHGSQSFDVALTPQGRLVVRGTTNDVADLEIGTGDVRDGFVVVDIATGTVESRILLRGVTATGVALDGEVLALSLARGGGVDIEARPLLRHGFRRVDLPTLAITSDVSVPGALIALDGDLVYTSEELWEVGWSVKSNIVVSELSPGRAKVLDRRTLPFGAFDLRVAGATVYYTENSGYPAALPFDSEMVPWLPSTEIHTLRLGPSLANGPTIDVGHTFASLLLVEESGALIVKNGLTVARFDVTGPTAVSQWARDIGIFPRSARADQPVGSYVLALGLGGVARVP